MILLVFELVLVLLLTGSGEAGEPTTDVWIVDGQWHGDPSLTTCPEGQACIVDRTKTYTCYQRMKEVMRAMDPYVQGAKNILDRPRVLKGHQEQWDTTINDCVKETP